MKINDRNITLTKNDELSYHETDVFDVICEGQKIGTISSDIWVQRVPISKGSPIGKDRKPRKVWSHNKVSGWFPFETRKECLEDLLRRVK